MSQTFQTAEEVAEYLGSAGTGMPPSYDGTGQYLRNAPDISGPIVEGGLLALDGGNDAARSEAIVLLQGMGGNVLGRVRSILEEQPEWWNKKDPHRGGTFGENFLSAATHGEAARDKELGEKLLDNAKGTAVEDEVNRAILAWRR